MADVMDSVVSRHCSSSFRKGTTSTHVMEAFMRALFEHFKSVAAKRSANTASIKELSTLASISRQNLLRESVEIVYHGTDVNNFASIFEKGFLVGGRGVPIANGSW